MAPSISNQLALKSSGQTRLDFDLTGRDEPRLMELPLESIDADPNQPRKTLGNLDELAQSIQEHGILSPLVVEPLESRRYRILTGERRYAAAKKLGLATVPCIVRTVQEQSRLVLQLIENLQRKDLHPVDEALAFKRLTSELQINQADLAKRLGKSPQTISEAMRILDLAPSVLKAVRTSEAVSKSVLLEIAKESDPVRQLALWEGAKDGKLTVRGARHAKRKETSPAMPVCTIPLGVATVVIRFHKGEGTAAEVVAVLEQALAQERGTMVKGEEKPSAPIQI